jgi:hypothetical protein
MREAIVIVLTEERDRERRDTVVVDVVCGWEEFWGRGRRKGKLF